MTDTEKIRELIAKKGLKMQFVARTIGLSSYGFALKINNKNEFKSSEIIALCDLLNIDSLEQKEELFFARKVDLKSTDALQNKRK